VSASAGVPRDSRMLDPLVDRAARNGVLRDVLGAQAVIRSC
jgi:hypothetical protein